MAGMDMSNSNGQTHTQMQSGEKQLNMNQQNTNYSGMPANNYHQQQSNYPPSG